MTVSASNFENSFSSSSAGCGADLNGRSAFVSLLSLHRLFCLPSCLVVQNLMMVGSDPVFLRNGNPLVFVVRSCDPVRRILEEKH